MDIIDAIHLLKFYNGPFELKLHAPASETLIDEMERACGHALPEDFKTLYRFTDGFETDEFIFNMMPLAEVIDEYKKDKQIWIAEYMIYSDMWGLEVNPSNPDFYHIISYREEICLTDFLAEFIARFLKSGVFRIGGLYHWADEIQARIYGNTDPDKIKPLLGVFYEGLKLGVLTEQWVIARANWIVSTEDEPHHLFIEITRSKDINELSTILNSFGVADDIIQVRALFGYVYTQLLTNQVTVKKVMGLLSRLISDYDFTPNEVIEMKYLLQEWGYLFVHRDDILHKQLNDRIKNFFFNYNQFDFRLVENWNEINADIVRKFVIEN